MNFGGWGAIFIEQNALAKCDGAGVKKSFAIRRTGMRTRP